MNTNVLKNYRTINITIFPVLLLPFIRTVGFKMHKYYTYTHTYLYYIIICIIYHLFLKINYFNFLF